MNISSLITIIQTFTENQDSQIIGENISTKIGGFGQSFGHAAAGRMPRRVVTPFNASLQPNTMDSVKKEPEDSDWVKVSGICFSLII
jgi:hypothetical protein